MGKLRGRPASPGSTVRIVRTGAARASRKPVASTTERTGRRSTRSTSQPHRRDGPCARLLAMTGTLPHSIRSPRTAMIAGRTVTEPTMATATTSIVPMPSETNTALPVRSIPAMAVMTVSPEIRTARPDVAAARARAVRTVPASVSLLELPPQVEHGVVHADGEPDEQDHGLDLPLRHGVEVADGLDQAQGPDHGGEAEQQRDSGCDQ